MKGTTLDIFRILPVGVSALFAAVASCSAIGWAQQSPELKVLNRCVGNWTVEFGPKEARSTGEYRAEWILDGTFIQKRGLLTGPDGSVLKTTSIVTYVAAEKTYRTWTFMSNGVSSVGNATWDPEKQVMTEIRENA